MGILDVPGIPLGQKGAAGGVAVLDRATQPSVEADQSWNALDNVAIFNVRKYGDPANIGQGDNSGDDAAIAAANLAAHLNGGVVWYPPGTYRPTHNYFVTQADVGWLGLSSSTVTILPTYNGDFLRVAQPADTFSPDVSQGPIGGFTIDGSEGSGADAVGMHYGDCVNGSFPDLKIINFNGDNGTGLWMDNVTNYTEGTWWENVRLIANTINLRFSVNGGNGIGFGGSTATNSFGYQRMKYVRVDMNAGQVGIQIDSGALIYNAEVNIAGNQAEDGSTFGIIDGAGSGISNSFLCIHAEQTGGTSGTSFGFILRNFGHLGGIGIVDLSSGDLISSAPTPNPGSMNVCGWVQMPGLAQSIDDSGDGVPFSSPGISVIPSGQVPLAAGMWTDDTLGLYLSGPGTGGAFVFRPNGPGSTVGQVVLDHNGEIFVPGNPGSALSLTPKQYVDAAITALQEIVAGLTAIAWQADVAYEAGQIVTNGAVLYQAPTPGGAPARVTFTPGDWNELATIALPVGTTSGTVAAGDDSRIVGALQRAGGTMTGALVLAGDATAPLQATTLEQVTAAVAALSTELTTTLVPYEGAGVWAPIAVIDGSGDLTLTVDAEWAVDVDGNAWYDPGQTMPGVAGAVAAVMGPMMTVYPVGGTDASAATDAAVEAEAEARAAEDTILAAAIVTEKFRAQGVEATLTPIDGNGVWAPIITEPTDELLATIDCEWSMDTNGNLFYDPDQASGYTPCFLGPGLTAWPVTGADVTQLIASAVAAAVAEAESVAEAAAIAAAKAYVPTVAVLKANNGSDFADAGSTRANIHVPAYTAKTVFTTLVSAAGIPAINDGYQCVAGDIVLLADETTLPLANGLWQVNAGTWTRPTDMPVGVTILGRTCVIERGTLYGGSVWTLNENVTGPVIVNTTAQTWAPANQSLFDVRYNAPLLTGPSVSSTATLTPGYLSPLNTTGGGFAMLLPNAPADNTRVAAQIQGYGGVAVLTCQGSDHFDVLTGPTTYSLIEQGHGVLLAYTKATALWTVVNESVSAGILDTRYSGPLTAADTSVVVGGTQAAPTVRTGTLDVIATNHPPAAAVNLNAQQATNAADPTTAQALATKHYTDTVAAGVLARHLANFASVTNQASLSGLPTIDGTLMTTGQTILLTGQTTSSQDGLWSVAAGAWTRPVYFATGSDATGSYVYVEQGTVYGGSEWFILGAGPITIDTTAQSWVEITGLFDVTVDSTLTKTGNQISRAGITGDTVVTAGSNTSVTNAVVGVVFTGTAGTGKVPIGASGTSAVWGVLTASQVTNAADKSSGTTQVFTGAITCAGMSSTAGVGGTYTSATGTAPATGVNYMIGSIATGTPSVTGALLNEIITSATGEIWICTVAGTIWWNVRNVVGTTISAQAIVSGAKFTPNATQDVELVMPITLGGTITFTMGPTTGTENSILPALTAVVAGTIITKRIPRNWGVIITLVTATIANATKQTL